MSRVELLTVEDRFQIAKLGLVIAPDFSVPPGRWENLSDKVSVITPDGDEFEALAQFNMTHFNISDPTVNIDKRWRVVLCLPEGKKDDLPVGSRILVSPKVKNAVLVGSAA